MIKFKIEDKPYFIDDFLSIENYSKIYKIKDLFTEDYFAAKLVSIVSEAPLEDLLECPYEETSFLSNYIINKLPTEKDIVFKDRFKLNDVDYGFFPNWKDLTFAEFVDMDTLATKKPDELLDVLHILAAVMYRPIVKEYSEHNFEIEKYDLVSLTKRAELFKRNLDVSYILGAQFFFIKFAKKYLNYIPQYSVKKLSLKEMIKMIWIFWRMKYKTPYKNRLGGFWSSTKLLTMILQNTNISTKEKSQNV